ncbi:MAG: stage II sporulation protein R [Clostridia bacterium]|nr:stage II sporulation protein R [Clostridia bacterium]
MQKHITVFLLTFSILTALMLPISAFFPTIEDAKLYDNIIRLHVLANSDSEEDQELKLKVRDGILDTVATLLDGVTDRTITENILSENLQAIESVAKKVLDDNSSTYTVSVTLTKEAYPTRDYENYTLPAGTYTSLRVLIGEAEGQNWWCVLFPQLCIGKTEAVSTLAVIDDSELLEVGLTPSQIRIIKGDSPDIVVKFRLLEFFEGLFS